MGTSNLQNCVQLQRSQPTTAIPSFLPFFFFSCIAARPPYIIFRFCDIGLKSKQNSIRGKIIHQNNQWVPTIVTIFIWYITDKSGKNFSISHSTLPVPDSGYWTFVYLILIGKLKLYPNWTIFSNPNSIYIKSHLIHHKFYKS